MSPPTEISKRHLLSDALFVDFGRRIAAESAVYSMVVEVCLERLELALEVNCVPEQRVVEEFLPNRADEPFHEGVGPRNVGNRLDLLDSQDPQIRLPTVKLEQRIVVGAEVARQALSRNGAVEQST